MYDPQSWLRSLILVFDLVWFLTLLFSDPGPFENHILFLTYNIEALGSHFPMAFAILLHWKGLANRFEKCLCTVDLLHSGVSNPYQVGRVSESSRNKEKAQKCTFCPASVTLAPGSLLRPQVFCCTPILRSTGLACNDPTVGMLQNSLMSFRMSHGRQTVSASCLELS